MKSRVKGDFQARFRENVRVKFPCVTRLWAIIAVNSGGIYAGGKLAEIGTEN